MLVRVQPQMYRRSVVVASSIVCLGVGSNPTVWTGVFIEWEVNGLCFYTGPIFLKTKNPALAGPHTRCKTLT